MSDSTLFALHLFLWAWITFDLGHKAASVASNSIRILFTRESIKHSAAALWFFETRTLLPLHANVMCVYVHQASSWWKVTMALSGKNTLLFYLHAFYSRTIYTQNIYMAQSLSLALSPAASNTNLRGYKSPHVVSYFGSSSGAHAWCSCVMCVYGALECASRPVALFSINTCKRKYSHALASITRDKEAADGHLSPSSVDLHDLPSFCEGCLNTQSNLLSWFSQRDEARSFYYHNHFTPTQK